jgi:hypothetical protein
MALPDDATKIGYKNLFGYLLDQTVGSRALIGSPVEGRITRIGVANQTAPSGAVAVGTLKVNGTSTAHTLTFTNQSAGDVNWTALDETSVHDPLLDVDEGDVIELDITSGTTSGGEGIVVVEVAPKAATNCFAMYGYIAGYGTLNAASYFAMPMAGKLKGLSWAFETQLTGGPAIVTVYRNGVSTGVTFNVAGGAAESGGFHEFGGGESDVLDFAAGDICEIRSNGGGTAGEAQNHAVFEMGPEYASDADMLFFLYKLDIGTAGDVSCPVLRRCRIERGDGAPYSTHTNPVAVMTLQKNGTAVENQPTWSLSNDVAGTAYDRQEFNGVDIGSATTTPNLFLPGDALELSSNGDGSSGEAYCYLLGRIE